MSNNNGKYNHQWRKTREDILNRDGHTCTYCGQPANTVDHVIPLAKGGDNHPDNLVAACTSCNSSKQDRGTDFFLKNSAPHAPSFVSPFGGQMRRLKPQGAFFKAISNG